MIDREELKARLGSVVLLDARGGPRYRGETEPIDPVAGHIPTARHVPVEANLVEPDGPFRPAAQLASHFRDLGADGSGGPVVTSCGSGVSALHHAVAMRIAGLPDPILYVGSYSDWSRSGEPVVSGSRANPASRPRRAAERPSPRQPAAAGRTTDVADVELRDRRVAGAGSTPSSP